MPNFKTAAVPTGDEIMAEHINSQKRVQHGKD